MQQRIYLDVFRCRFRRCNFFVSHALNALNPTFTLEKSESSSTEISGFLFRFSFRLNKKCLLSRLISRSCLGDFINSLFEIVRKILTYFLIIDIKKNTVLWFICMRISLIFRFSLMGRMSGINRNNVLEKITVLGLVPFGNTCEYELNVRFRYSLSLSTRLL